MSMISWIKLDINILDDSKIKIIRSHPNGDAVIVMWIGLLCLAMKSQRAGLIEIAEGLPYTIDDLSSLLGVEKKTVEMGIALFCKYRMIDVFDGGCIEVLNFRKHQNLEEIERKRELTKIRVSRYRDKLRNSNALLTHNSVTVTVTDKDLDKDLDKEKDIAPGKPEALPCPHQKVISLYHEILPKLPKVAKWTPKRMDRLRSSWADKSRQSVDWWRGYFEKVNNVPFLLGENERKWKADLEWLVTESNLVKVIEGKYSNASKPTSKYFPDVPESWRM